jgi:hypothetical protein
MPGCIDLRAKLTARGWSCRRGHQSGIGQAFDTVTVITTWPMLEALEKASRSAANTACHLRPVATENFIRPGAKA